MLHDPKTVIVSDFDQETAEKIAPQFIPRLELANCTLVHVEGTFGLALFVANLAVKHLALVLMDIPNVNFESVFS